MYSSTSLIYKVSAPHSARQGRCSTNVPLGHSESPTYNLAVGPGNILRVVTAQMGLRLQIKKYPS